MDVQARLSRLEQRARWQGAALVACLLALGVAAAAGAGRGRPGIVEARQLVVVGEDGKARAVFGTTGGTTVLAIYDGEGVKRVSIGATADGGAEVSCLGDDGSDAGMGVRRGDQPFFEAASRSKQLWRAPAR